MDNISDIQRKNASRRVKILSYNVHSCVGTDRKVDPGRIAEVIAAAEPDIIGLQEVDVGRKRTGGIDQAQVIASLLQMDSHFYPALHLAEEKYGDAMLTAFPVKPIKAGPLPSLGEQRGAIWTEIDVGGIGLHVINTHLGLRPRERALQVEALLGGEWLGNPLCQAGERILMGDFNAIPTSSVYRTVGRALQDAQMQPGQRPRATFPSRFPLLRLDHVFVSVGIRVVSTEVIRTPLARKASDHLPLLVTLDLPLPAGISSEIAGSEMRSL